MNANPKRVVSIQTVRARGIAAVHARVPSDRIPAVFATYLDQVYAAARAGKVNVDGQNIFLYRGGEGGMVDVDFGVGVAAPFTAAGRVTYVEVPGGEVATATHAGDFSRLRETHAAILDWCRAQHRELAGPRWEVYGHVVPGGAPPGAEVYYLLAGRE